jgi:hypothetical protein
MRGNLVVGLRQEEAQLKIPFNLETARKRFLKGT